MGASWVESYNHSMPWYKNDTKGLHSNTEIIHVMVNMSNFKQSAKMLCHPLCKIKRNMKDALYMHISYF